MKDIDFLPADYRQQTDRRRGGTSRLLAACALLAIVGGVDIWQRIARYSAEQELAQMEQPFLEAQQLKARLATLQQSIGLADDEASLLAYLDHRWPVTQLVAVPTALPAKSIQLVKVEMNATLQQAVTPTRSTLGADTTAEGPIVPEGSQHAKALADLQKLAGGETLIVTGTTSDPRAAQAYVTLLSQSPLVKSAKLQSVTSAPAKNIETQEVEKSKFVVQIVVVDSVEVANHFQGDTASKQSTSRSQGGVSL